MFSVTGIRPRRTRSTRTRQWPKFGKETMARRPMRSRCSSTTRGLARRLDRLREDHVIEGIVRIIGKVRVGIALDHRQALARQAFTPSREISMPRPSTPLRSRRMASSEPSPQPISSTRSPARPCRPPSGSRGGGRSRCRSRAGWWLRSCDSSHPRRRVDEAGCCCEHLRLFEQEGVVALVALHLDEADGAAAALSA